MSIAIEHLTEQITEKVHKMNEFVDRSIKVIKTNVKLFDEEKMKKNINIEKIEEHPIKVEFVENKKIAKTFKPIHNKNKGQLAKKLIDMKKDNQ